MGSPQGTIEEQETATHQVAQDVLALRTLIANVAFYGKPGQGEWVLIDTGLALSAPHIFQAATDRFGSGSIPQAIILTHGHFDHVGALSKLLATWQVPVYAHEAELPFLTGQQDYPAPDPHSDPGLIARMSAFFPHKAVNLGGQVQALPSDGSVPGMPGWRWIHTPGHTPGHVALFRESDRVLIAGDAFVTVRQESAAAVLAQKPAEVHGPPKYLTPDWPAAKASVERLYELRPAAAVTGHGPPMTGSELHHGLEALVQNFDQVAVPAGALLLQP